MKKQDGGGGGGHNSAAYSICLLWIDPPGNCGQKQHSRLDIKGSLSTGGIFSGKRERGVPSSPIFSPGHLCFSSVYNRARGGGRPRSKRSKVRKFLWCRRKRERETEGLCLSPGISLEAPKNRRGERGRTGK